MKKNNQSMGERERAKMSANSPDWNSKTESDDSSVDGTIRQIERNQSVGNDRDFYNAVYGQSREDYPAMEW
jgi:hypothetical protein